MNTNALPLTTDAANIYVGGQLVGKAHAISFDLHKSAQSAAAAFDKFGQSMVTLSLQFQRSPGLKQLFALIDPAARIRDLRYQAKRKGRPGWRAIKISRSKAAAPQITAEFLEGDR